MNLILSFCNFYQIIYLYIEEQTIELKFARIFIEIEIIE